MMVNVFLSSWQEWKMLSNSLFCRTDFFFFKRMSFGVHLDSQPAPVLLLHCRRSQCDCKALLLQMKTLIGRVSAMHLWFNDPLPCLNVEVVCGPRVLVVMHRRRKDHGKDLKLSQPMLEAKEEEKRRTRERGKRRGEVRMMMRRALRRIYKRERCSGEEVTTWKRQTLTGKGGGESNEKNGQKLEKRDEKQVNWKKRDAGNRTPSHKNVEAKSDIKDPEKYAAWEIHYRQGWKETNGKKEIEEKVRKAKKKTSDKTSSIENCILNSHFITSGFSFSVTVCQSALFHICHQILQKKKPHKSLF